MKAFALTSAQPPATLVDLPDPEVPAGSVRIRVRTASVNGFDLAHVNGYFMGMLPHEFPSTVGRDFAGVVDVVGEGRTDVAVGDEVFGFVPPMPVLQAGSWAEFVVADETLPLVHVPAGLSAATAAAIPLAGVTALDSVDAVDVGPGDVVLVIGATGGVGSVAVQVAAQRGATVIATARAGDEETYVRSLGAAETVDYSAGDVAAAIRNRYPDGINAVIDLVNRDAAFAAMAGLLGDGGRIATTLSTADVEALAAQGVQATNIIGSPTPAKLAGLAAQVAAGTLRVDVQATFALADAPAAMAAFVAGTRGKVVITVGEA